MERKIDRIVIHQTTASSARSPVARTQRTLLEGLCDQTNPSFDVRISAPIPDYTHVSPFIVAVFLFAAALGAQTKPGAPAKPSPAKAVPAPGASAQQDKEMEAAIRAKLAKSKIGKDGFTVRVQGGAAYWEGSTNILQHKGAATRMAKSAGATRVINNIKVSDAAKQAAAENLDQGRRRVQVTRGEARSQ
jgi:hypothetical protein